MPFAVLLVALILLVPQTARAVTFHADVAVPMPPDFISASGIEQYGIPDSSIASTSGLPRDMALPTTTRSGRGLRFSARNPSITEMQSDARMVLIGG